MQTHTSSTKVFILSDRFLRYWVRLLLHLSLARNIINSRISLKRNGMDLFSIRSHFPTAESNGIKVFQIIVLKLNYCFLRELNKSKPACKKCSEYYNKFGDVSLSFMHIAKLHWYLKPPKQWNVWLCLFWSDFNVSESSPCVLTQVNFSPSPVTGAKLPQRSKAANAFSKCLVYSSPFKHLN